MGRGEIISPHRITTVACSSTPTAEIFPKHCNPLYPKPLVTKQIGIDILHDSLWNKGMAFSHSERDRLGLRGLIPPVMRSIEVQVERCLSHINGIESDINKNLYLQDLQNRNETLFHRVLLDNIEKMAPLIYTPTVGVVCQEFGHQFRRPRGMFFSRDDRGEFSTMVNNWPHDDVHVIVVTDGSRILGLGDLGVHGMGIPVGKLALYCAAGGIAPHRVLPVILDVGTDNPKLLKDPSYVGIQKPRLQGEEYYDMLDEFMKAVFARWPDVVVQFEDFQTKVAVPLLSKYKDKYRCFNDDIQGTGCVTLSALMSSARNAGSSITDMRVMCAGAGSAGLGVCELLVEGMIEAGLSREEAVSRFVVCTEHGTLGRRDGSQGDKNFKAGIVSEREAIWCNSAVADGTSILDAMKTFKPTVLLGMTAHSGVFTEELVRTMSSQCDRPIIMPMSNPTSNAECTAEEAYRWSDGRAVVGTGSPFAPVTLADGRTFTPSQCNNMYVFPGLGLAMSVAGVSKITNRMLYEAAVACTNNMTSEEIAEGRTFPALTRIREVSHAVACAVINEALKVGLTTKITAKHIKEGIPNLVSRKMYFPSYVPLVGKR